MQETQRLLKETEREFNITQRAFYKDKREKKITVKHYLNTKLKPVFNEKSFEDGKERFAIYVRMVVLGKSLDIKSKVKFPVALDEFESVKRTEKEIFNTEIDRITNIIKVHNPFERSAFDLKGVSESYSNLTIPLDQAIENSLKRKIQNLLISISNYDENEIKEFKENQEKIRKKYQDYDSFENWELSVLDSAKEYSLNFPKVNTGFYELLDWQNSTAFKLISFLRNYSFTENIRGFKAFDILFEEFIYLWDFDYTYNQIRKKCNMLEPTPIDWLEKKFIQKTIQKILPNDGEQLIININNLLGENPYNKV